MSAALGSSDRLAELRRRAALALEEDVAAGVFDPEPGCLPESPAPFLSDLPPLEGVAPDLDPALLPGALGEFVFDVAERAGGPPEYAAGALLTGLGACIGGRCGLYPKMHDSWCEFPNLWGLAVGPPGAMKSGMVGAGLAPIKAVDRERRERWEAERKPELDRALAEADGKLAGMSGAKARDADPGELAEWRCRKAEAESALRNGPPRVLTSDATYEKLAELLKSNPAGMLCQRDELSAWLAGFDRQGREQERGFYLEGWTGRENHSSDRIGRGSLYLPRFCLGVFGSIQPGPLSARLVRGANAGGAESDGLLERFQLVVYPEDRERSGADRPPNERAAAAVERIVRELLGPALPERLGATPDRRGFFAVRLTPEAAAFFAERMQEANAAARAERNRPVVSGWLAKMGKLIAALSLLFHAVNVVEGRAKPGPVGLEAVRLAAAWAGFLQEHAVKAFGAGGAADPALRAAHRLLAQMRAGEIEDGQTVRDVHRNKWKDLQTPEQVADGLSILARHGIAWVEKEKPEKGRPARVVRFNPEAIR
jgi:hypothetical protein